MHPSALRRRPRRSRGVLPVGKQDPSGMAGMERTVHGNDGGRTTWVVGNASVWAATLDDALAPILQMRQGQGRGVRLPPAGEFECSRRREAMNQADIALRFTHTHTLYAHDHIIVDHSLEGLQSMARDLARMAERENLYISRPKMEIWSNNTTELGKRTRSMGCALAAQEDMDILGSVLSRRPQADAYACIHKGWKAFWARIHRYTSKRLGQGIRLRRWAQDILP